MSVRHYKTDWQGIALSVAFTADCSPAMREVAGIVMAHIEVKAGCPLPITKTGYRSLFLPLSEVEEAGGPIPFLHAWLDAAAEEAGWQAGQLSLL